MREIEQRSSIILGEIYILGSILKNDLNLFPSECERTDKQCTHRQTKIVIRALNKTIFNFPSRYINKSKLRRYILSIQVMLFIMVASSCHIESTLIWHAMISHMAPL